MTYPFADKSYAITPEVLVYSRTVSNTTAGAGVQTSTVDLPPGVFTINIVAYTATAGVTCSVRVYAHQTPAQGDTAVLLSDTMDIMPHSGTTAVTSLLVPSSATAAGTSGQLAIATAAALDSVTTVPYGLFISTKCSTSTGTVSYKITAQRRM